MIPVIRLHEIEGTPGLHETQGGSLRQDERPSSSATAARTDASILGLGDETPPELTRRPRLRQMTPASITRRAIGPSAVLAATTDSPDRACAWRRSGCAPAPGARAARLLCCGMTSGGLGVIPGGRWAAGGGPVRHPRSVPAFRQRRTTVVLGATDGRSGCRRRRPCACGAWASHRRTVPIGASHDPRSSLTKIAASRDVVNNVLQNAALEQLPVR